MSSRDLQLLDQDGDVVKEIASNKAGKFKFKKLLSGQYTVQVSLGSGWTQTSDAIEFSAGAKSRGARKAATSTNEVGIFKLGTISGQVYVDSGTSSAPTLSGWTIQLFNSNGDQVGETQTDANGNYSFTGLVAGRYEVRQVIQAGWTQTSGDASYFVNVKSGTTSLTNSFGNSKATMVSGYVYHDANADGNRTGDQGIANVVVTLTGKDDQGNAVNLTAVTDANGFYAFDELRPSDAAGYTLTQTQPVGYLSGQQSVGSLGGIAGDDSVRQIVLPFGTDGAEYNFAEVRAGKLSGYVFVDPDLDGQMNVGDSGLGNVIVTLTGTNDLGQPVELVTSTNSLGYYEFAGLRPGTYSITQTQPDGYLTGVEVAGSAGGQVSTNQIRDIVLQSNANATLYNFGELGGGSISGMVYVDQNNDGIRQDDEVPIAGVWISLVGMDDLGRAVSRLTQTDNNGNYLFSDLRPGTYTVSQEQPLGYLSGLVSVGSAGGLVVGDRIEGIQLQANTVAVLNNFGERYGGSISGTVYIDENNDGVPQTSETPLTGVWIQLTGVDDFGQPVSLRVQSDADGNYVFSGLQPGTYTLTQDQPEGYLTGSATSGASGGAATPGEISGIDLEANAAASLYNFGNLRGSRVSGSVFLDDNDDGIHQPSESPLAGVWLNLTGVNDQNQSVALRVQTDADGQYMFSGLRPGIYSVMQEQPEGYLNGIVSAGSAGGMTSDSGVSGITVSANASVDGYHFGELRGARISGTVYLDDNDDGIQQPGETPLAGVWISLLGTDDSGEAVSRFMQTDDNGGYEFSGLQAGTYTVIQQQPLDYLPGKSSAGDAGGVVSGNRIEEIYLQRNAVAGMYNFGELRGASIAGAVYLDANDDGIYQTDESPLAQVEIYLTGEDDLGQEVFRIAQTSADGTYIFTGLRPGTYSLIQVQPSDYLDGRDAKGSGDGIVLNDRIDSITVSASQALTGYHFAELAGASVSGQVFVDLNHDGEQQPDEPTLAGVWMTLNGVDDLGMTIEVSAQTDAQGGYRFSGLRPGVYSVTQQQPGGYLDGDDYAGNLGAIVGNDLLSAITVSSGESATGYLFSELLPGVLTGLVYVDANFDGVYQDSEAGIADISIQLTGIDDRGQSVSIVAHTDASGRWTFHGLRAGTYQVTQNQPANYLDGTDATVLPGAVAGHDMISQIVLGTGAELFVGTFGEELPASISGSVYIDRSNDGYRQTQEAGVSAIEVMLTGVDDLGQPVNRSTVTDLTGFYSFTGLRAGTYAVSQVLTGPLADGSLLDGRDREGSVGGVVNGESIVDISLPAGVAAINYTFGELLPASLSGSVYLDGNDNGLLESGELPLAETIVQLTGQSDRGLVSLVTTTDEWGHYEFTGLRPGQYAIAELQQDGYLSGHNTVGTLGGTVISDTFTTIYLNSGSVGTGYLFGNLQPGAISGTVFNDANGNALLDGSESGLSGFVIELYSSSGELLRQQTTTVSGAYRFDDLPVGTYTVKQVSPSGWINSTPSTYQAQVGSQGALITNLGNRPGILLTSEWFASRGAGPYLLSNANTTYQLDTDITVNGTAFVIGGANIVLDLNGHTVTYGNSNPVDVRNGGFEEGTGSTVTGWNLTAAPTATLVPAKTGMWGDKMLQISNFSTTQTITSDPIMIPASNREYSATVTPSSTVGVTVTLRVIDAITGQVLATGKSAGASSGFSAVATFSATTNNPVRLQIEVTPPAGKTGSVDLDYADLFAARDYGVVASPSSWYFPTQNKSTAITSAVRNTANVTIRNGSLIQGNGHAYNSASVYGNAVAGITVQNVNSFINGMDSTHVDLTYATTASVLNSTLDSDIDNVSNRMNIFASITLYKNNGTILIDGNRILNSPQVGIEASNNQSGTIQISNNYIANKGVVSNPYAIMVSGLKDFVIANNTIISDSSRGISLDSWDTTPMLRGEVYGNYVRVTQQATLEYTATGMAATALRVRNWGSAQRELHIYDNTFIATSGPGNVTAAVAVRITQDNRTGLSTDSGNFLKNNVLEAYVLTTDIAYKAWAISVSGVSAGTGLEISNNVLVSNDIGLNIGDSDSWDHLNAGILFLSNTIRRSTEGAIRNFKSIYVGDSWNSADQIQIVDTRFENGALPIVNYVGPRPKEIELGWVLSIGWSVAGRSAMSSPESTAQLEIYDSNGEVVYAASVDIGQGLEIPLITQIQVQESTNPNAIVTTNKGPFTVVLTWNGQEYRQTVSLTESLEITFDL